MTLTAPFPWFGGKSRAASTVWRLLGDDVTGYVEPFCGSLAVLLARPEPVACETVNDADGFVANFWRAVSFDADAVAAWADWPVNEVDLEARHAWLVNRASRLRWSLEDPDFYDAKMAGWWVWGACAWIGSGWCSGEGPHVGNGASIVDNRQLPHLGNAGQGINRKLPHLGDAGQGINRKLPHLGDAGQGINRKLPHLGNSGQEEWLRLLQARLRRTRVACGDWSRVVTDSVLRAGGDRPAVFLDPPYGEGSVEYSAGGNSARDIARDVWAWAIERPRLRVVVAAYEDGREMPRGWTAHRWDARKGYQAKDNKGRSREVLYASPACGAATAQVALFGESA